MTVRGWDVSESVRMRLELRWKNTVASKTFDGSAEM